MFGGKRDYEGGYGPRPKSNLKRVIFGILVGTGAFLAVSAMVGGGSSMDDSRAWEPAAPVSDEKLSSGETLDFFDLLPADSGSGPAATVQSKSEVAARGAGTTTRGVKLPSPKRDGGSSDTPTPTDPPLVPVTVPDLGSTPDIDDPDVPNPQPSPAPSPQPSPSPDPDPTPSPSPTPNEPLIPADAPDTSAVEAIVEGTLESVPTVGAIQAAIDLLLASVPGLIPQPVKDLLTELSKLPATIGALAQGVFDLLSGTNVGPTTDAVKAEADARLAAATATANAALEDANGVANGVIADGSKAVADALPVAAGTLEEAQKQATSAAAPVVAAADAAGATANETLQSTTKTVDETLKNPPSPGEVHEAEINSAVPLLANDANGISIPVQAGHAYTFKISGTYKWTAYLSPTGETMDADASCAKPWIESEMRIGPDFVSDPEAYLTSKAPGSGYLNVLVNGEQVQWTPAAAGADPQCSTNHVYTYKYTADGSIGQLNFKVKDDDHVDNIGALTIDVNDKFTIPVTAPASMLGGGTWLVVALMLMNLIGAAYRRRHGASTVRI